MCHSTLPYDKNYVNIKHIFIYLFLEKKQTMIINSYLLRTTIYYSYEKKIYLILKYL